MKHLPLQRFRPGWVAMALAALACTALPAAAREPAVGVPAPVQAPHHGSTLFHFFQGQDFAALGALMTSQHFQRLAPHGYEAELLRGGLLLSYGLHREAGRVFDRLIDTQATPAVRDRAWYHLALIRQQRGWLQQAEDALSRISAPLPDGLETPRQLLTAQLLMARGAYGQAAQRLQALAQTLPVGVPDSALAIARFNLGVALVRSGLDTAAAGDRDTVTVESTGAAPNPPLAQGLAMLDTLGQQPAADEEQRSLRDRANLALGLAALRAGQPGRAQAVLQRVRLDSPHASAALLGLGWALAEQGQPQQALAPWTELAERDQAAQRSGNGPTAAMLQARVALPQALADAGAWGPALAHFDQALAQTAHDHHQLQQGIAQLHSGLPMQALLARHADTPIGWFARLDQLPPADQLPHAATLAPVLASHAFQEGFKNWRDLHHLGRHLADWRGRLSAFEDVLATRSQAWAERLPPVQQQQAANGLPTLQARHQALIAALQQAEQHAQVQAFASPAEQALQQRLARAQATLQRLQASADTPTSTVNDANLHLAKQRMARAAGALLWQQTQQFPARLWQSKKALQDSQQALARAQAREDALREAQRSQPAREQALTARITALSLRLEALVPQLQAAADEQQAALQTQAVLALQAQQQQLVATQAQALLARAQLLDRMQLAQRATTPRALEPDR